MKRIIIIEDHPIVLLSLKSGLHGNDGIEVLETFTSGRTAIESEILNDVDLALLDINLPDIDGFQVCKFLSENYPAMKIIGISSFEDAEYINRFIQMGAHGYMVKGTRNSDMIIAINQVLSGKSFFCDIARRALLIKNSGWDAPIKLTQREKRLINLLQKGTSTAEIGAIIGENEEVVSLFVNLLEQKISFYNIDVDLKIPSNQ